MLENSWVPHVIRLTLSETQAPFRANILIIQPKFYLEMSVRVYLLLLLKRA